MLSNRQHRIGYPNVRKVIRNIVRYQDSDPIRAEGWYRHLEEVAVIANQQGEAALTPRAIQFLVEQLQD